MLVDNVIDESSARYFCVFNAKTIEKAVSQAKKFAEDDSEEKLGIQTAIAIGPNREEELEVESETLLCEGLFDFLKGLLNSPPAWVEEPTGFNLCAPEEVFKDDVKGGILGYNNGLNLALAASGVALTTAIPPLRRAAISIGKKVAKSAVKHPIATGATAVALSNSGTITSIAKNTVGDIRGILSFLSSLLPYVTKICGAFKPLVDFFKKHPIYASSLGAIGYGLLKTYPIWWPYMRRLGYELTSGDILAKCEFDANGSSWRFEYSARKNKWILLNSGKIASAEDSLTFIDTDFAERFIDQCEKNFNAAFKNKKMILAQAALAGGKKLEDRTREFLDAKQLIKANMFKKKMMFERDNVEECDGGAAAGGATAGGSGGDAGAISGGDGIASTDVLGSCDHGSGGFLGPGCFHVPSKCAVPFHRWEICNGGSKRKKTKKGKLKRTPYEKNMKVVYSMFEDELD